MLKLQVLCKVFIFCLFISNIAFAQVSHVFNVQNYGAIPNDGNDDSTAIQMAIDAAKTQLPGQSPQVGGKIVFPPGRYDLNTGLMLPKVIGPMQHLKLEGYGAVLYSNQSITFLGMPKPTSMSEAGQMQVFKPTISGLRFLGVSNVSNQVGLQLFATLGAVIEDVTFEGLDTGLDLVFTIMTRVRNCLAGFVYKDGFVARSGWNEWPGASQVNSGSNSTVFESLRVYAGEGLESAYKVLGSSNVRILDSIAEGANPKYNVFFDAQGSTTVKTFAVNSFHSENSPTDAIFRIRALGRVHIDNLWHQPALQPSAMVIDATDSRATVIRFSNTPFLPGGWPWFRQDPKDGAAWFFDGITSATLAGGSPFQPQFWDNEKIPRDHWAIYGAPNALVLDAQGVVIPRGSGFGINGDIWAKNGIHTDGSVNAKGGVTATVFQDADRPGGKVYKVDPSGSSTVNELWYSTLVPSP